jgi:predicted amidophosphoribosyltransferase
MNCPGCDDEMEQLEMIDYCNSCGMRAPSANVNVTDYYIRQEAHLFALDDENGQGGSITIPVDPFKPIQSD